MKVDIQHSMVQDMSVVKFLSLKDYFRAIQFLENAGLQWTPLKYSSSQDSASIRLDENVLNKFSKRFGIGRANESKTKA